MEVLQPHVPPHSLDAEQAVLGSMLLSQRAAERLLTRLRENDFYSPIHRDIFRAMVALNRAYKAIDMLTVSEEMISRETFDKIGGAPYLVQLCEAVPSTEAADYYAEIVIERALLRDLETAAQKIGQVVHDPAKDFEQKLLDAERWVYDVGRRRVSQEFLRVSDLALEFFRDVDVVLDSGEPMHGLPSGLTDLDDLLTGFYPGNLIILAARPAVGKTSLALWFAYYAAQHTKQNVAVFSLEMSGLELVRRFVTMLGKVDANVLKKGRIPDDDYQGLIDGCEKLYDLKMYIDDSSDITVFDMMNKCRRLKAEEGGLSLIVVDYLQLMRASNDKEPRVQQISNIARGLKIMAKDLEVPVIALSQLSRGIELRDPPIPHLSDLRESGSIEADADVVMMLYKGKQSEKEDDEETHVAPVVPIDVFIRKNRNGPTDIVTLAFEPSYTLFSSAAIDLKRGLKERMAGKGSRT